MPFKKQTLSSFLCTCKSSPFSSRKQLFCHKNIKHYFHLRTKLNGSVFTPATYVVIQLYFYCVWSPNNGVIFIFLLKFIYLKDSQGLSICWITPQMAKVWARQEPGFLSKSYTRLDAFPEALARSWLGNEHLTRFITCIDATLYTVTPLHITSSSNADLIDLLGRFSYSKLAVSQIFLLMKTQKLWMWL